MMPRQLVPKKTLDKVGCGVGNRVAPVTDKQSEFVTPVRPLSGAAPVGSLVTDKTKKTRGGGRFREVFRGLERRPEIMAPRRPINFNAECSTLGNFCAPDRDDRCVICGHYVVVDDDLSEDIVVTAAVLEEQADAHVKLYDDFLVSLLEPFLQEQQDSHVRLYQAHMDELLDGALIDVVAAVRGIDAPLDYPGGGSLPPSDEMLAPPDVGEVVVTKFTESRRWYTPILELLGRKSDKFEYGKVGTDLRGMTLGGGCEEDSGFCEELELQRIDEDCHAFMYSHKRPRANYVDAKGKFDHALVQAHLYKLLPSFHVAHKTDLFAKDWSPSERRAYLQRLDYTVGAVVDETVKEFLTGKHQATSEKYVGFLGACRRHGRVVTVSTSLLVFFILWKKTRSVKLAPLWNLWRCGNTVASAAMVVRNANAVRTLIASQYLSSLSGRFM